MITSRKKLTEKKQNYYTWIQPALWLVYMLRPELDLHPKFNSGLSGLNLGHRFNVDPTWVFSQRISENTKIFLNQH